MFGKTGKDYFLSARNTVMKKSTKSTTLVNDILIDKAEVVLQGHEIKKYVIYRQAHAQTDPCFWPLTR